MKKRLVVVLVLLLIILTACSSTPPEEEFTLEEKIGQLIISIPPSSTDNVTIEDLLQKYKISGVVYMNWPNDIFGMDMKEVKNYTEFLQKQSEVPLFISADIEGGEINRIQSFYPLNTSLQYGLAYEETDDKEFVVRQYQKDIKGLAKILKELGINVNFAPVIDVEKTREKGGVFSRYERSYSTKTETVAKLGEIYIETLQKHGVLGTIKHFPGHGPTPCDTFLMQCEVDLTEEVYRERDLVPFIRSLQHNPKFVMVGLFSTPYDPGVISIHSKKVVTGLLRDKLGYDGIVITDDYMMGAVKDIARDTLTLQALEAGTDMFLTTNAEDVPLIYEALLQGVKEGKVSEERIDVSFGRVLKVKKEYFG